MTKRELNIFYKYREKFGMPNKWKKKIIKQINFEVPLSFEKSYQILKELMKFQEFNK
jgi:hypothetical protein